MTFTEPSFVLLLLSVYGLWLLFRRNYWAKLGVLLIGSIVFYGYHHWELLFLITGYCLVNWTVGWWIQHSPWPRVMLTLGVVFNMLVLGYWKYLPGLLQTGTHLAQPLQLYVPQLQEPWILPMGISFYTFTGIAYLVDVYRGSIIAEGNLLRFALFFTFFPKLVAGPILRAREFLTYLHPESMPEKPDSPGEALFLLARGYFKKMVLADRISQTIDPFFLHIGDPSTEGVWALPYLYLYSLQIYFDFSAYTDIARGLGLFFGFRWPENFRLPYLADSIQDFWRRWHITLSTFLRDYLYIPLGGNRKSLSRRYGALLITMLLCGLWHGGNWSLLVWGGLHGVFLVIHRIWSTWTLRNRLLMLTGLLGSAWRFFCIALTFHCVALAWCFFRLTSFPESILGLKMCFVFDTDKLFVGGSGDPSLWALLLIYGIITWGAIQYGRSLLWVNVNRSSGGNSFTRGFQWGASTIILILAVLLRPNGEVPPFIYFQF